MVNTATPSPMGATSPSRRALLGAAVWSVPAISLATAAPSFATSPGAQTPTTSTPSTVAAQTPTATVTTQPDGSRHITGSVTINNPSTTTATVGLQAIFSMPSSYMPTGTPSLKLSSTIGNWTITGYSNNGTTLTVTLNAPKQLAANASTVLTFDVTAQMPHLPATAPAVSVWAKASNMPAQPAIVSFKPGTATAAPARVSPAASPRPARGGRPAGAGKSRRRKVN